jgi:hypothetical protein
MQDTWIAFGARMSGNRRRPFATVQNFSWLIGFADQKQRSGVVELVMVNLEKLGMADQMESRFSVSSCGHLFVLTLGEALRSL